MVKPAILQSTLTSPKPPGSPPFSDVFELAQFQISEAEIVGAGSGSEDEAFSVVSSMSSFTAEDDDDDNDFFGSGGSWHDTRDD